jgi:hypothetical protein
MTVGAISCLVLFLANVENFLSLKTAGILWVAVCVAAHIYNYSHFKTRTIRLLAERMDNSPHK